MAEAADLAFYFSLLADSSAEDAGEAMTHLKMQKLLYYAQGFSLVILGRPIFGDPLEAWDHGPVVRSIWNRYKGYGRNAIPATPDFDPSKALASDEQALLNDVWNAYGQFSAWKLREMTHNEPPWKKNFQAGLNNEISHKDMREYFKTQVTY